MDFTKLAQRRSVLNKLRDITNVSGRAAENFFNPEFKEVMESLREADDHIWSIVKGEPINSQDPGEDMVSLKELIKGARSNFNRREYITAVNFLGRFHKKVDEIVNVIKGLNFKVDKVHHEFLFKDLDSEQEKYLEALKNRFAQREYPLKKEAGIADLLTNLLKPRGRALSAWEKRYPGQVKKFKGDVGTLLNRSENMFKIVESQLHEMGKFKAQRKVDDYMNAAKKIGNAYSKFDADFKTLYSANIKEFVNTFFDRKKEMEAKKETMPTDIPVDVSGLGEENPPVKNDGKTVPDVAPVQNRDIEGHPDAAIDPEAQKVYQGVEKPGNEALKPAKTPDLGEFEEEEKINPDTLPPSKAAHQKFVSFLETMGSEDPKFLSGYITRYARQIEESDPESSIGLLQLVRKIGG